MRTEIVKVTPSIAAAWLKNNTLNRKLSAAHVKELADRMKRGVFMPNGASIVFGKSGRFLDGQHRLAALINAGVTMEFIVVRDVEDDAFATIDDGRKRSGGDVFAIAGEKNASTLAAGARWAILIEDNNPNKRDGLDKTALQEAVHRHPMLRAWASKFNSTKKANRIVPAGAIAVFTLAAEIHGDRPVQVFFDELTTGFSLNRNSPALMLRDRAIGRISTVRADTIVEIACCIKAVSAHCYNRPMKMLRWKDTEIWPTL